MFFKSIYIKYFCNDITNIENDDILSINFKYPIKISNIYLLINEVNSFSKKFEISFYEKHENEIISIDPAKHIFFKNSKYEDWFMDFIPPFNLRKFTIYDDEIYEIIRYIVKMNRLKLFL